MDIKYIFRYLLKLRTKYTYLRQYKTLLKLNQIPNKAIEGECQWVDKWSTIGKPNPVYYRLFSQYIGNNLNIVPEDICRNVIEPILSPLMYVPYYSDKNMFDKLFGSGVLPESILRKMNGFYYGANYDRIILFDNGTLQDILSRIKVSRIVIKPTVNSCSGNGVRLFHNINGVWEDMNSHEVLTLEYLDNYYDFDFIIQECLEQADWMAYYNSTSVNTLRLSLYRSVKTDEFHVTGAIIRIGKNGALVDNAHAGGGYCGIHPDGTLCNRVLDQYGVVVTKFNGIDFTLPHKIPNWDTIVEFAKKIGESIPHHRLLALDIMVDKFGDPRLIEFNCEGYSMWLFQFTIGPAFNSFTDEIIEYCKNHMDKSYKVIKF